MKKDKNKDSLASIIYNFPNVFPLINDIYEIYAKSPGLSKDPENTLRRSLDNTTLEVLELVIMASRQNDKDIKAEILRQAYGRTATMKVFADCAYQTGLTNKKATKEIIAQADIVLKAIEDWQKNIK